MIDDAERVGHATGQRPRDGGLSIEVVDADDVHAAEELKVVADGCVRTDVTERCS